MITSESRGTAISWNHVYGNHRGRTATYSKGIGILVRGRGRHEHQLGEPDSTANGVDGILIVGQETLDPRDRNIAVSELLTATARTDNGDDGIDMESDKVMLVSETGLDGTPISASRPSQACSTAAAIGRSATATRCSA